MLKVVIGAVFLALVVNAANASVLRNLEEDTLELVHKMQDTILSSSSKEMGDFDSSYNDLRKFMDENYVGNEDIIAETTENLLVLSKNLQDQASEHGVSIEECLEPVKVVESLNEIYLDGVKKCYLSTDNSAVTTREVLGRVLTSIRGSSNNLEYDLSLCEDDNCRQNIADQATLYTTAIPYEIYGAGEMAVYMTSYLKDTMAYCFVRPQVEYVTKTDQISENLVACASDIIPKNDE